MVSLRTLAGIALLFSATALQAQNPAIVFSAGTSPITPGGSSTLVWTTTCPTNTCTYSIDQGIGAVSGSGSRSVSPASTTTYTLQVVNAPVGIFEATVTVFVGTGRLQVTQSAAAANGGPGCTTVLQYGVCEVTYTYTGAGCSGYIPAVTGCSGGAVRNPWEDVVIAATFTGQTSGKVYNIGGFYEGGANSGNGNQWKVRFSPPTAETWNYSANFSSPTDYALLTNSGLFTSTAGGGNGFLALNKGPNPFILQTTDGTAFYPFMVNITGVGDLGNNMVKGEGLYGVIGGGQSPATGYQGAVSGIGDVLGPERASGFNTLRAIWDTGVSSYIISTLGTNNNVYLAGNAGATSTAGSMTWDALLRVTAANGLHEWCTPINNPYAFIAGGNVFASTATTQEYMHAWQYIVNRYGAYCDVWELGNELLPVPAFMNTLASWVKQQDPYKHLTAISYPGAAPVANLDLQSDHNYLSYTVNPTLTLAGQIVNWINAQENKMGSAPIIFGEAGLGSGISDPPANEDFRQWQNVSFFNQAFESVWPNHICNGFGGANTECVDTAQLAQMAVFSTFAGSVDPAATKLSVSLGGGANGQLLSGWALGSSSDVAGYILNVSNRKVVHGAVIKLNVPAANMAGEWIAPSTGALIATFTTAASPGSQTFTIPDFSATPQNGDIWLRLRATPRPVVMTFAAPGCLVGASCSLALSAAGGAGSYSWVLTAGALPPGLTLNNATGAVTGAALQSGNWNFTVVATDSSGAASAPQKLILVVFPRIAVGNTKMDNFPLSIAANAYHLPVVVTGGMPPVTCAVTGQTPPGLSFNGFCGPSGAATASGTYTFTATATDSLGNSASASVTATVPQSVVDIVQAENPNATAGWPFNWTHVTASGGAGPYTWSLASGSLPAGLSLSGAGGFATIFGTPSAAGSSTFSLTATDSNHNFSVPQSYTLITNPALSITTSSLPVNVAGSMYYASVGTSGGTPPFWCSVAGALPQGFILDAAACEIYGISSASGSFPLTVTAWDSNGYNVSSALTLSSTGNAITFGALNDVMFGSGPFNISATASSGLTVSFTSSTPAVCIVAGTIVTVVGAGNCSITAIQNGNGPYGTAAPVVQSFTVHLAGTAGPVITPGSIGPLFSSSTTIQPGSWISIYGSNLAAGSFTWDGTYPMPTSLGGVTVTINGQKGYLYYVGPGQINLQAPDDSATGIVGVTVTNASGSWTSTVTLAPVAPALSLFDAKHVAGIILRFDGSGAYDGGLYDIIGPAGTTFGYPFPAVPAKPGDIVVLYGVGFGPTSPPVPAGQAFSGAATAISAWQIKIGGTTVQPSFTGIGSPGLYQINLTIPGGLGSGDQPLTAVAGGAQTQNGIVISLQ